MVKICFVILEFVLPIVSLLVQQAFRKTSMPVLPKLLCHTTQEIRPFTWHFGVNSYTVSNWSHPAPLCVEGISILGTPINQCDPLLGKVRSVRLTRSKKAGF